MRRVSVITCEVDWVSELVSEWERTSECGVWVCATNEVCGGGEGRIKSTYPEKL